ncbi:MAG TPA: helix-turn-helix domain-containing protein [Solirubrobacteraceae bacterium]|nr:helix-turn-helix domain-containing protein [Solirubrobacteraceae bacterium]
MNLELDRLAALNHPMRFRIYVAAANEPVSAKELAEHFEEPLPRVSYHVRALADAGLIKAVRRTQRRGAVETHYEAPAPLMVSDEAFEAAPAEVRRLWVAAGITQISDDVQRAIRDGASDRRKGFLFTRAHLVVDEEGLDRLDGAVRDFYAQLAALEEEVRGRAGGQGEAMNVVLGLYPGESRRGLNRPLWMGHEGDRPNDTIPPEGVDF